MSTFEQTGPADGHPMIALWRNRAEEARAQASQMKDGSVSQELLLGVAALTYGWPKEKLGAGHAFGKHGADLAVPEWGKLA